MAVHDCRERLIDATLDLCVRYGYENTPVEDIAAVAEARPSDFARYFATKDAVLLSIVENFLHATAAALGQVDAAAAPEQALLIATTDVLTAISDGRGAITRERMLAMAEIVTANSDLRKQASFIRKRVLTEALAARLRVAADHRRVRHAVTKWSAIAAGAYVGAGSMGEHYDPRRDDRLMDRWITELTKTFTEVMGKAPPPRS